MASREKCELTIHLSKDSRDGRYYILLFQIYSTFEHLPYISEVLECDVSEVPCSHRYTLVALGLPHWDKKPQLEAPGKGVKASKRRSRRL